MTRFGEISPLWHTSFKNFGHFDRVNLVFGNILSLLWQFLYTFGQFFNFQNAQILSKYFSNLVTLAVAAGLGKYKARNGSFELIIFKQKGIKWRFDYQARLILFEFKDCTNQCDKMVRFKAMKKCQNMFNIFFAK